ncbi:MAG: hypothetical protein Q8865_02580 [Bacillota bacterium]|nr:hypothetical protein [Bacillota bacterium]
MIFSKDHPKICALCEKATKITGREELICQKRGIVREDYTCRGFRYDVFKRIPMRRPSLPTYDKDDFSV